jgi:hypothetical protein
MAPMAELEWRFLSVWIRVRTKIPNGSQGDKHGERHQRHGSNPLRRGLTGHGKFVDDVTRRSSFSHSGPFGTVALTRGCATLWANVIIPWCRFAARRGVTVCSMPFCRSRLLPGSYIVIVVGDTRLLTSLSRSYGTVHAAAPTDPKVSTTPSSNRFSVTLDGICVLQRIEAPPRGDRHD